eukprot:CAMPEP_0202876938 /NCGR_PEP_ID=MMETSP1391-20130828/29814_1 /ASSEMBLY_ACC=CAM_ASM_000867 /TAXON_ID=1034604 /ORGANISM="Chlamydomonas leiostraca, Strain SAG 11-49" /LENGTH=96 /DNA_ID=CAMNT_0049558877 /DNA_START=46 /DNA_END=333 /DNA_ORIENTATION=-
MATAMEHTACVASLQEPHTALQQLQPAHKRKPSTAAPSPMLDAATIQSVADSPLVTCLQRWCHVRCVAAKLRMMQAITQYLAGLGVDMEEGATGPR